MAMLWVAPLILPTALAVLRLYQGAATFQTLFAPCALAAAGYALTVYMVPRLSPLMLRAGIHGRDINKGTEDKVPEALGLVPGTVYLLCIIFSQLFFRERLGEYTALLATVCFIVLLGFSDDVLNLRWRYKLVMPAAAALPLLLGYSGATVVVVPAPLTPWLGTVLDLGLAYYAYMLLFAVFCSNAINIYAGINGLEAGQSLVIGCAVLAHNMIELGGPFADRHAFSLALVAPFVACTLGLLRYNWYPSAVFVGDVYTYFSGMTLATVSILGHYTKTLMLFFLPQIANFLYSIPQLIGLRPCPRHRLPRRNAKTGLLESSGNLTLLNLTLEIFGPMGERQLCIVLLVLQAASAGLALAIRYGVACLFYEAC